MDGSFGGEKLCVERVRVAGVDVGVPAGPFVARVVGLRMDLRGDGLEHEHDLVSSQDGPEVVAAGSVASTFIQDLEAEPCLVEIQGRGEVVDDEEGSDGVEHAEISGSRV